MGNLRKISFTVKSTVGCCKKRHNTLNFNFFEYFIYIIILMCYNIYVLGIVEYPFLFFSRILGIELCSFVELKNIFYLFLALKNFFYFEIFWLLMPVLVTSMNSF